MDRLPGGRGGGGQARLRVAQHPARGKSTCVRPTLGPVGRLDHIGTVVTGSAGRVLVATGATWYERAADGTWTTYPAPTPVPAGSDLRLFYTEGGALLGFADRAGDLTVSRRTGGPGAGWSVPSTVAPAGSAEYVDTKEGGRLVTRDRAAGEAIRLFDYEPDTQGRRVHAPRECWPVGAWPASSKPPRASWSTASAPSRSRGQTRAVRPGVRVMQEARRFAPPLAQLIPGSTPRSAGTSRWRRVARSPSRSPTPTSRER